MVKSIQISGKKLSELRSRKFFSQEDLARQVGLASGSVGRLEQVGGGILISNFKKLADAFRMSPEDLVKEIGAGEGDSSPRKITITELRQIVLSSGLTIAEVVADLQAFERAMKNGTISDADRKDIEAARAASTTKRKNPPSRKRAG